MPVMPSLPRNFRSILDPQAAAAFEQAELEAGGTPSLCGVADVLFALADVQLHAVTLHLSRARLNRTLGQIPLKASAYRENAAPHGLDEFLQQLALRASARGRGLYATEVLEALVAFGGSPVTFDVSEVVGWAHLARRTAEAHGRPLTLTDAVRALAESMSAAPARTRADTEAGSSSPIAPESLLANAILTANAERAEDLSLVRVCAQLWRAPAWRRELLRAGFTEPEVREPPPIEVDAPNALVVFHDDDVTTFEFVTRVLHEVVGLPHAEAARVTTKVDAQGSFAVGPFPTAEAVAFVTEIRVRARESGYPLKVTVQPA